MRPFYVDVGGEPVLSLLHETGGNGGPAILLCPPFGREDAASYRCRRDWAESLAAAGLPVLRFDLQATGDSGGRIDEPGRLESWIEAVRALAELLRAETGRRTAAIGIGLGGMLAVAAAAEGAPLDELVLWGVPGHGRSLARELTTFARIEAETMRAAGAPEPPPEAAAKVAPGGFLLPGELLDALRRLDLCALRVPGVERALLLGRDGIPPDDGLRAMLEESGARVETADGDGFGEMMTVLPEAARLPGRVRESVGAWLAAPAQAGRAGQRFDRAVGATAELPVGDAAIRETPLEVVQDGQRLFGILAEPLDRPPAGLALVLLNAGAIRRSGPGRLWVELARHFAAKGTVTLRVDLAGIGDASGTEEPLTIEQLYSPVYVEQVRAVLDAVATRVGAERFALLGLCAGAYWGFHTALADERVGLVAMLNPRLLFWDAEIVAAYDARSRRGKLLKASAWQQFRELRPGPLVRRVLTLVARLAAEPFRWRTRLRAHRETREATNAALDRLEARGVHTLFAFCDGEPLRELLVADGLVGRAGERPHVEFVDLPGRDHVLRPLWMHEHVHAAVDRALASELARSTGAAAPAG
jgi:pimeloyl-ACP methyl ester carboxylesterase